MTTPGEHNNSGDNQNDPGFHQGYDDQGTINSDQTQYDYDVGYDDTETTQFYPQDVYVEDQVGTDEYGETPYYDFSYDRIVDNYKNELDYINIPGGHRFNNEWVSKYYYDQAYDALVRVGESGKEIIHSLNRSYGGAASKVNEQSTYIERLETDLKQAKNAENNARNYQLQEKRQVEEDRKELDRDRAKQKTLVYSSIGAAVVAAIVAISFLFMWIGAKNDSESEMQRGTAHQEKIEQLESDIKDSQAKISEMDSQNKDLHNKNDALTKRAKDAEKAADDVSKDLKSKDEEIDKLKDELNEAREASPETVTQTAPPEVRENTITSTVTVPAPNGNADTE